MCVALSSTSPFDCLHFQPSFKTTFRFTTACKQDSGTFKGDVPWHLEKLLLHTSTSSWAEFQLVVNKMIARDSHSLQLLPSPFVFRTVCPPKLFRMETVLHCFPMQNAVFSKRCCDAADGSAVLSPGSSADSSQLDSRWRLLPTRGGGKDWPCTSRLFIAQRPVTHSQICGCSSAFVRTGFNWSVKSKARRSIFSHILEWDLTATEMY